MKKVFLLLSLVVSMMVSAQDSIPSDLDESAAAMSDNDDVVFVACEKAPQFPGGTSGMMRFLSENVRYPIIARENGIQGRVICQFIVNKDGSVSDVTVARSVDPLLDREAVRVIKSMPKWQPGEQRGKLVRVKYTLPISFKL